ncbi:MAG: hypothetical protein AAF725_26365, partial [Acidobacteriota bacterium]
MPLDSPPPGRVLGVDLDHTLICYDRVLPRLIESMGFASALPARGGGGRTKTEMRDAIRRLPEGEVTWQRIQARLYGQELVHAEPFPGALAALRRLGRAGWTVHVVSHKTRFPRREPRVDLRAAALDWLGSHRFFDPDGAGLNPAHVHFAGSREAKVRRVRQLGCEVFIDDLPETFAEPEFPSAACRALLFSPAGGTPPGGLEILRGWTGFDPGPEPEIRELARRFPNELGGALESAEPLGGGRNSRVLRLRLAGGERLVAKRYALRGPDRLDPQEVERRALD